MSHHWLLCDNILRFGAWTLLPVQSSQRFWFEQKSAHPDDAETAIIESSTPSRLQGRLVWRDLSCPLLQRFGLRLERTLVLSGHLPLDRKLLHYVFGNHFRCKTLHNISKQNHKKKWCNVIVMFHNHHWCKQLHYIKRNNSENDVMQCNNCRSNGNWLLGPFFQVVPLQRKEGGAAKKGGNLTRRPPKKKNSFRPPSPRYATPPPPPISLTNCLALLDLENFPQVNPSETPFRGSQKTISSGGFALWHRVENCEFFRTKSQMNFAGDFSGHFPWKITERKNPH